MRNIHTWNADQAKAAGVRSGAARRERLAERLALAKAMAAPAPLEARPGFVGQQLERVRVLLEKVSGELLRASEPRDVRDLACALAQLQEQERELAGRPRAGSLRPGTPDPAALAQVPAAAPIIELAPAEAPTTRAEPEQPAQVLGNQP